MIEEGKCCDLEFTDSDGDHLTRCKLIQYGWGIDRRHIYYIFKVLESGSKKYSKGSKFYLGFDFNDKENIFLFYPPNEFEEKRYKSFIKII